MTLNNIQEYITTLNSGVSLYDLPQEAQENKTIVSHALTRFNYINCMEYIHTKFRDDKEIAKIVLSKDGTQLSYFSDKIKRNKEIIDIAVSNSGLSIKECKRKDVFNDKELALKAIETTPYAIQYFSATIRKDEQVALSAIQKISSTYKFLHYTLKHKKSFLLKVVKYKPTTLYYFCDKFKNDLDICIEAVINDLYIYYILPKKMKVNENLYKAVILHYQKNNFNTEIVNKVFLEDK